ncbi:gag/pol protein [Cucumis melo var. makuwa]|uniref:Gag/pol protein n=1 Tax=Cucumis melo var. makuwa TaxID=1194695 RepID=A0A5A7VA67_CUCMM|nr:gag/pol protein [Cucumis melo var. makuwa]
MSSSIIALLKKDQLTGENYATWKSKLNMILVIADLRFVLMEECPPFPTQNASQSVKDAYDHWTKANDKASLYMLASLSDILSKKHEIMVTARQIMDSLREMFGQPSIQIKQEAIKYVYNARMKEGQSVREHVLGMIVNFNVAEMNKAIFDEKSQVSYILKSLSKSFLQFCSNVKMNKIEYNMTTLLKELQTFQSLKGQKEGEAKGKGKAKVAIKGKCFHYNVDGHWKRNCPKYFAKKKEKEEATNHVCSSLQETSSFKQLEEDKMTLKMIIHGMVNYLYLMEHKSEALEKFKEYKAEVENLLSKKIKILRSDRGGEYMDLRFQDYMIEHGIQSQLSAPSTPRKNVETVVHILNNVPSNSVSETPFELWRGRKPSLSHFRIWGCLAHVLVTNPKKLEPRSKLCQFVGYHHMRDHKPRSKLVLNEAIDESTRVVDEVGPSSRVDETTTLGQSHPSQSVVIPDDGVEDPLSYKQTMNDVDKDQ